MHLKFIMFELFSKTYLLILLKSCKKLQHAVNWANWVLSSNMYKSKNEKYCTKMLSTLDDTQYI